MKDLLPYLTKYGASGVLAVWLLILNMQVKELQSAWKDCMEKRIQHTEIQQEQKIPNIIQSAAILPDRIRIKKKKK